MEQAVGRGWTRAATALLFQIDFQACQDEMLGETLGFFPVEAEGGRGQRPANCFAAGEVNNWPDVLQTTCVAT